MGLDALTTLILVTCIGVIAAKSMDTAVRFVAVQALLLAMVAARTGYLTGNREMYLIAGLTLLVKGIAIPAILMYVINKIGLRHQVEPYVKIPTSLLIAGGLIVLAYGATQSLDWGGTLTGNILSVSVSLILLGLLVMTTRKKAVTQIVGLILMENGLYLAAVAMTRGMPLIVELGIFFDLFVGVLIMGILVFRINETFDTIDTARLKSLKG